MTRDNESVEAELAHLRRAVEDLSDIVARQDRDIAQLLRRVEMLVMREAEREAQSGGAVLLGDQKPPHW